MLSMWNETIFKKCLQPIGKCCIIKKDFLQKTNLNRVNNKYTSCLSNKLTWYKHPNSIQQRTCSLVFFELF